ncbi:MAG TPA: glycine cleavage T C-terminal barrel domain-containing protein [Pyrinomonadaceae bacterium]|nr:glycine cleavage T C-terminal barrel domain-containing protein [Pyrinomonadaceae bacterium]
MIDYAAVRDGGAGLIDLSSRGRLRVSGSEATMFLNGLITNDMKTLGENRWMPAAFPTVQGRLIGAVRVVRERSGFLIDTDAESHEAVLKTVSRFTLAGDFHVKDLTSETAFVSVQGKRAVEVVENVFGTSLSDLPRDGVFETQWQDAAVTIIRATHTAEDGFDLLIDSAHGAQLRQALIDADAQAVSAEIFEILRIEAGIARFGRDMDETNVVTETNLDDAVSYTKGCYVGQEIIVRIKHRGHVAKKLTGLRFQTAGPVEPGSVIKSADGKEIGKLTSTAFSPKLEATIALGYVRYEYLNPGTIVVIDPEIEATTAELPFIRGSWYEDNG